jgi:hypothetical protein
VLLFTWNRAYYQYHPASQDHVDKVETLVARHRGVLTRWRRTRLAVDTIADAQAIQSVFGDFELVLGPVGAAKGLHLLAPNYFPIWDRSIAPKYRCGLGTRGTNAPRYIRFMRKTAIQCGSLEKDSRTPMDVVKALDEWNYVHFTKGLN